jgi:hypothetical protein
MKVVINTCFGGFGLSQRAVMRYAELKGIKLYRYYDQITLEVYGPGRLDEGGLVHYTTQPVKCDKHSVLIGDIPEGVYFSERDIERNDPLLVQVVEELGPDANGRCAKLSVIEIPDGINYEIDEYDGNEHIAERHRTWR